MTFNPGLPGKLGDLGVIAASRQTDEESLNTETERGDSDSVGRWVVDRSWMDASKGVVGGGNQSRFR